MMLMRVENPDVKEYAIKFLALLFLKSEQFTQLFKENKGPCFMNECLN